MPFSGTARARLVVASTTSMQGQRGERLSKVHEHARVAAAAAARLVAVLADPGAAPSDVVVAARASSRASDALFAAASWAAETP